MADALDDGEFWLPSHFLTEEDILMDFDASASASTPTTISSTGFNSDLGSPVDSVTETESDEDELLSGLTRQMSLSSLLLDAANTTNSNSKGWATSSSPQSTLSPVGGSSRGSPTGPVSPLPVSSAGESKKGTGYFDSSRGLLCPLAKQSTPVSISPKNPNFHGVFSPKSQPFQPLWNQEMIKQQRTPPTTAWPTVQRPSIRQPNPPPAAQKMRAVFLGAPGSKRESVGTGVFLPRNANPTEPRKKSNKQTCATVLVPEKVVQALKNINAQSQSQSQPRPDSTRRLQGHNNGVHGGRRYSEKGGNFEIRLPSEWTY